MFFDSMFSKDEAFIFPALLAEEKRKKELEFKDLRNEVAIRSIKFIACLFT